MNLFSRKKLQVHAACGCHIGKVRENNEDNFCFNGIILPQNNHGLDKPLNFSSELNEPICFGVFDGMGGESNGEEAAFLAAHEMKQKSLCVGGKADEALLSICHRANDKICSARHQHKTSLMGSTAAMLILSRGSGYLANLGDSKIWLWRQKSLIQLSTDHTDQGLLSSQGIKNRKPQLTQHLGIQPDEMVIEPAIQRIRLHPDDRFILCSDGLSDMLTIGEITAILDAKSSPLDSVNELVTAALRCGGRDNITVIDCRIETINDGRYE